MPAPPDEEGIVGFAGVAEAAAHRGGPLAAADILRLFEGFDLNRVEREYLDGQATRLAYVRNLVQGYCSARAAPADILDVGPHFLTRCLAETILPPPRISTIGAEYAKLMPPERVAQHASIDLNDCAGAVSPLAPGSFDIVTICEVIEHLFVPPDVVLSFLRPFLKPPDGVLIVGTPNAVSISKRLKMLLGENPFQQMLPNWREGGGHIREYTMQELRWFGAQAGLSAVVEEFCDYWPQYLFPGSEEISSLEREVPRFRTGLTIVYKAG
jgi:2-polyprenyl-3-methyl-5-hydroxy-6-metoxy-1,4-benzoquinol methylase